MRLALVASVALAAAGCWDFEHLATLAPAADGGAGHDAAVPPSGDDLAGTPPADLAGSGEPRDLSTSTPPSDLSTPAPSDLAGNSCSPGAACSTGSPGVCAAGHISCAGGSAVCAPDNAPAAKEGCFNDTDDDCDGHLNNGCPDHLALGPERALGAHGGSGGSPASLRCPAGSFVLNAGFWGNKVASSSTGIEVACGTLTLSTNGQYVLTKQVLPGTFRVQGANGFQEYKGFSAAADCAGPGLAAATWFTSHTTNTPVTNPPALIVSGFGAHCGTATLVAGAGNQLSVQLDASGAASQEICYGTVDYCYGAAYEDHCRSDEVLVGFNLRMGDLMDSIAPVCAPLLTVYQ